jgi:hypothetical protein
MGGKVSKNDCQDDKNLNRQLNEELLQSKNLIRKLNDELLQSKLQKSQSSYNPEEDNNILMTQLGGKKRKSRVKRKKSTRKRN